MTTLIDVMQNLSKVASFVNGDGLAESIREIEGSDSVSAANFALSTSSKSRRDRINSAITHLEKAHVSYYKIYSKGYEYPNGRKDVIYAEANRFKCQVAAIRDVKVCCLLSICYIYLNDKSAVNQMLRYAQIALRTGSWYSYQLDDEWLRPLGTALASLNPESYRNIPNIMKEDKSKIDSSDFVRFRDRVLQGCLGISEESEAYEWFRRY